MLDRPPVEAPYAAVPANQADRATHRRRRARWGEGDPWRASSHDPLADDDNVLLLREAPPPRRSARACSPSWSRRVRIVRAVGDDGVRRCVLLSRSSCGRPGPCGATKDAGGPHYLWLRTHCSDQRSGTSGRCRTRLVVNDARSLRCTHRIPTFGVAVPARCRMYLRARARGRTDAGRHCAATSAAASCSPSSAGRCLDHRPTGPHTPLRVRMGGTLAEFSGSLAVFLRAERRNRPRRVPALAELAGVAGMLVDRGNVTAGGDGLDFAAERDDRSSTAWKRERESVKLSMTWKLRLLSLTPRPRSSRGLVGETCLVLPTARPGRIRRATGAPLRRLDLCMADLADRRLRRSRHSPPRLRHCWTGDRSVRGIGARERFETSSHLRFAAFDVVRRTIRAPAPVRVIVGDHGSLAPIQPFIAETRRALVSYARRFWRLPLAHIHACCRVRFRIPRRVCLSDDRLLVGDSSLCARAARDRSISVFQSLVGNNQSRDPWPSEGFRDVGTDRAWEKSLGHHA